MFSPEGSFKLPSWMVIASVKPKNKHASKTGTGRHFAKINAASAINPRPAVIFRVNKEDCPMERYAPPAAAKTPEITTAIYLKRMTFTPAASAASGFSPVARSRKPNGVLYKTYQQTGTSKKAKIEAIERRLKNSRKRCACGICGVEPEES